MGHSSLVHAQTYHLFINEREQQQAYDLLVAARKNQHFTGSFLRREINDVT
jgi:hypothetical protein